MAEAGATATLKGLLGRLPDELSSRALSHSSWVEQRGDAYGRLAFLGDSVLGLAVASELYRRFPEADIGELTKVHNQAVSGRACAEVARDMGLPELLETRAPTDGTGLSADTLVASERTLASVTEAVIGACYLEHGFEPTAEAVIEAFEPEVERATESKLDFKSELQEWLARSGVTVSYDVVSEDGPPHERRFDVKATVQGDDVGVGSGRSKKEAEQAAAERALEQLKR
ncbi:MAG: ribonuclease III [Solirubrobacterales bacterium]|nr:ribonuclease III [Solirubrobacterales bacterium]